MHIELTVLKNGSRLDSLLAQELTERSRNKIKTAILDGWCTIDGKIERDPSIKPRTGQKIVLELAEERIQLEPAFEELEIVWQDRDLAIVNKPPNLVVHPCPSCNEETLCNRLLGQFPQLASMGGERPGIVHRLDKDTSGLLIVALTEEMRLLLMQEFAARKISKKYLAIVRGRPPLDGYCDEPIGRHTTLKTRMSILPLQKGGKEAHTSWRVLWQNKELSLLEIAIKSGRTHQIRVHMAHLGYPLAGDPTYGDANSAGLAPRQMLHAWKLSFIHPLTGQELSFCAAPPQDFFKTITDRAQDPIRMVITGNQGCGKSAFCKALEELHIPVISADDIVAGLYSGPSEATRWIASHIGEDCINSAGQVDKKELFACLQKKPWLKQELEKVVHGLVQEAIESFWERNSNHEMVAAEIPLYFESQIPRNLKEKPLVVGIHCPKEERFRRLMKNRHWTREKIVTMESWQLPEEKKMGLCDLVIDNTSTSEHLANEASALVRKVREDRENEKKALAEYLERLCQCPKILL